MEERGLLSLKIVKSRDYHSCKKKVDDLMYRFEEYRYRYHEISPPQITPNYEVRLEFSSHYVSNPTENYVQKKLDAMQEIEEFYLEMSKALSILCKEELIYFKGTYYNRMKEEKICDILNISRDSLRRIKESCIVKIAMYYKIDILATH